MTPEQFQELVDAASRCARALETLAANKAAESARGKSAGNRAGKVTAEGRVSALRKDWPNDHGWYSAKIAVTPGTTDWFTTKAASIAKVLERAKEENSIVRFTFNPEQDGKYKNNYLQTIEIIDEFTPKPKPEPDPVKEDMETPF